jgi:hypothetical protein
VQGGQINASGGLCLSGVCKTTWPIGTVTGVTAGTGLSGGGSSGTVTLNIANGGITDVNVNASAAISPTKIAGTAATLGSNTFTGAQTVNGTVGATAFLGDGSALTNLPYRARSITYLAGCDSCSTLVALPAVPNDSQHMIYINLLGTMTINSVSCYSDAGSPTINIAHNGTNILTTLNTQTAHDLTCPSGGGSGSILTAQRTLNTTDTLDFVMQSNDTAKRITVVILATLN